MSQDRERPTAPPAPQAGLGRGPGGGFGPRGRGPVQKPKQFGGTLRRLWRDLVRERRPLIVVFLFILVSAGLGLVGPYLIGTAIDGMDGGKGAVKFGMLYAVLFGLAASYLLDAGLSFAQGWIMAGVSQQVVRRMRGALFAKLQKLPLSFFDTRKHGELMSRLSNDIDNVSTSISQTTTQLMSGVIAIVGSLVMMIVLSPLLTLASLITVPLVYLLARTVTRRTGKLFKRQQEELGKLNGQIEETISGLLVVKAFNRERHAVDAFEEVNGKLRDIGTQAQIWSGFLMPLLGVINNIGFTTVAVAGGVMAVKGSISVGVIASFLSYSRQFVRPLNDLANVYNVLQSGVAGAERVFEVLDEGEEPADPPDAIPLEQPVGRVVFEHVSFGYRPDVPILRDVSFVAEAGSSVALVGPTGAGKTTIVQLLTRFYDVTGGRILIDGRDIRSYTRDSLRRCFGVVLQDTYLFSGTIRENILYGSPEATEAEMRAAAAMANADGFIRRLPQQYETMLTENGGNLSQGQRQLIAIARVMLAKPSILILDEATSSIDTRTELHIQDALLQVMKGRTSFVIAHRLNTIRDADEILVVDRGGIAERGTHRELLEQDGIYGRMFRSQFKNAAST
ncbi:ABC transporter ATP-binding protein [Cohnella sp. REN36]|uniref:ABC transporter ATP-binding protein n=1 Tax=Cohnella sp. REN36 TaxID=2887347 RepID=UPI001D15871D|nr:ABC transporter ATP-binding protein [Cohnella sp. REN36]MCC3371691.1 ABC transporter ATP-binding protein/permease [Cohnella sp. REN36]